MSARATAWAWDQEVADHTAKFVLLAICDHAHGDGTQAWPGITRIAKMVGISERMVQKHLKTLESEGLLVREMRSGRSTLYTIPVVNHSSPVPNSVVTPTTPPGVNHSSPELEVEPREGLAIARPSRRRAADPHWDALIEAGLTAPTTDSERGRWNAALKQLRDAGVPASEIPAICKKYRSKWPSVDLTPTALAANLSLLRTRSESQVAGDWLARAQADERARAERRAREAGELAHRVGRSDEQLAPEQPQQPLRELPRRRGDRSPDAAGGGGSRGGSGAVPVLQEGLRDGVPGEGGQDRAVGSRGLLAGPGHPGEAPEVPQGKPAAGDRGEPASHEAPPGALLAPLGGSGPGAASVGVESGIPIKRRPAKDAASDFDFDFFRDIA